jgi:hypothetical protein
MGLGLNMSSQNRIRFQRTMGVCALTTAALLSCQMNKNGEAVDYGPEFTAADLNKALSEPVKNANPLSIQIGQFVHYSVSQELAGAQVITLLSDTGQTVVDRVDTPSTVELTVVQNKFSYSSGQSQKASLEYQLNFDAAPANPPTAASPTPATTPTPVPQINAVASSGLGSSTAEAINGSSAREAALRQDFRNKIDEQIALFIKSESRPGQVRVQSSTGSTASFHRLTSTETMDPPPGDVATQPNCLGVPNCKMHVYHIGFDQLITAVDGTHDRVHFALDLTTDVPMLAGYKVSPLFDYFPGLIKSCVSLLVPVGDTGAKVLLTECNKLENFRYLSATP